MSPTARALAHLRKLGYRAQVVERWNQYAKVRQDLFGIIDIVAVLPPIPGIIGVQATSRSNHAARRTKALAEPALYDWLKAGGRFEVMSFAKQGPRGKAKHWNCWREDVRLSDIPPSPAVDTHTPPGPLEPVAHGPGWTAYDAAEV